MMRIARGLILVAFTILALTQGYRWVYAESPADREVAEIRITGNAIRSTQDILSQMGTRPGKKYSITLMQEDVGRLYQKGWFNPRSIHVDTNIRADGKVIVFVSVQELSNFVQEIIYRGADHMGRDELDKLTKLKRGEPMSPHRNKEGRLAILRHYQEKSRYWASVKIVEGNKETDQRVVFDIAEGPVVRIHSIDVKFFGPHESSISAARLKTQLNSGSAFLGVLGGNFNEIGLDMDVLKLEEYYHALGYLKARVERELIFSKDLRDVDVVFHIEEGERHRIELFEIRPNKPTRDPKQLMEWTDVRPGVYYSAKTFRATKPAYRTSSA